MSTSTHLDGHIHVDPETGNIDVTGAAILHRDGDGWLFRANGGGEEVERHLVERPKPVHIDETVHGRYYWLHVVGPDGPEVLHARRITRFPDGFQLTRTQLPARLEWIGTWWIHKWRILQIIPCNPPTLETP